MRKLVTVLALLALSVCLEGISADGGHAASSDSTLARGSAASRALLFLEFENGKMDSWKFDNLYFARDSLGIELAGQQKNNRSRGVLHCFVRNGLSYGSVSYVLSANGISPIRVTPRTMVAWCWKVSENEDTDGFWLCLNLRNTKTGVIESARFVTWIEHSHSVIRAYFDPSQVWVYHCEALYDYLWRRYNPAVVDSFVIENVTLGASSAPKLEAWIDNIWIGEGEPRDSVNVIETIKTNKMPPSKLTSFSYGFLNGDWIPDRVDVYRDRAEILINPQASERSVGSSGRSGGPSVRVKPIRPFQTIPFNPQRCDGFATVADLNGDGLADILLSFDDILGSRCFENGLPRERFREVALRSGALRMEQEYSYGAAASDVDLDGDLDVLQLNPYSRSYLFGGIRLFRNGGDFSFVDGTADSWVLSQFAFGCTFGDVDGDGCQDLFAGYRWYYNPDSVTSVNRLYLNDGKGKFIAAPENLSIPPAVNIYGGVFADFDNDGDLDLYVVVSEVHGKAASRNMLFLNDSSGKFVNATDGCGAAPLVRSRAALAEDFDNDGFVDLYLINPDLNSVFYKNRSGARFEEVPDELMCSESGWGGASVDFDRDGDLDIAIRGIGRTDPVCIENTSSNERNFIEVRLRGTLGGRGGIGAKVYLYETGFVGEKDHLLGFREINSSKGFAQHSPPVAHFGLGDRRDADLEVVFPSIHGQTPVIARERGVRGGSFLEISEHRSAFVRRLSDALTRSRNIFDGSVFRIPSWLFAVLALIAICAAGAFVRMRVATSARSGLDLLLLVVIVIAAVLAIYRSVAWGVGTLFLALLLTLYYTRLEDLLRSVFQSKSWRDSATEFLLEELSQAVHTEKKFTFLMEISLVDEREVHVPARSYDSDFKSLKKLVSMMRLVTPADQKWRQAGAEIKTMRKILGELRRLGKNAGGSGQFELSERTVELQHAIGRLNTLLRDYRAALRRVLSVSFIEEWGSIRGEYESTLREQSGALEEAFPEGVDVVRIHLGESEFRHIFKNLFDNSLRALREAAEKRIRVAASLDATHLTVRWTDTGPGIPKQLAGRLFNEVVPSSSPRGKGEGCAITGQIIRRRQGLVRLEEQTDAEGAVVFMKFLRVK